VLLARAARFDRKGPIIAAPAVPLQPAFHRRARGTVRQPGT